MSKPQSKPAADPRRIALEVLAAVLQQGRPLDEALAGNRRIAALAPRDRAFLRLLVTTVLRRRGQIDALLDRCLERPLKPGLEGLRDLLRLGTAQLLFIGTPVHAAVDTSVRLAGRPRLGGFKGLINAVLRRLAREGAGWLEAQDAARLNTPDWLWTRCCTAYGEAQTRAIAEAHFSEPPLDLTLKATEDAAAWAARLDASVLPNGSLRLAPGRGEVGRLPGYDEGAWWVQDAAAALPARLLGELRGRAVVDLCAAPGGKTAALADAGAEVIAVERSEPRLARLRDNLQRLGLSATTVAADATDWRPPEPVAAVLLDAPCSATGTLRRHPDVAWLKRPEDLPGLIALQDRLLAAAAEMLAPGGLLVYATCSLLPEEGEDRIAALLAAGAPFKRLPIEGAEIGGLEEALTGDGELRILPSHWPQHGGLDGFFASRLRRL
jgi:16S rRNA (cytosine967-C5)-methyltransferase